MNIFHKVLELWPGHESGTYGRTDGWTDVRDGQGLYLMPFRYSSNRRVHKIQKPKMQELFSLFMTHRLSVMHALVKFHEYIPYG